MSTNNTQSKTIIQKNTTFHANFISCLNNHGFKKGSKENGLKAWARKYKINYSTIHKCYTKPGHVPTWDMLLKLSDIFNKSINWLLTGSEFQLPYGLESDANIPLAGTIGKEESKIEYIKWLKDKDSIINMKDEKISGLENENQKLEEKVEWIEHRFFCDTRVGDKDVGEKEKGRNLYRGFNSN